MENKIKLKLINKLKSTPWRTPFYFYDLDQLELNFLKLQNALSNSVGIYYSMKSNPHHSILKRLHSLGALIDISSEGELTKALSAGFTGKQMSFVGPGKNIEELTLCIDQNIEYTVIESLQELEIFSKIAKEKKKNPKFCIRICPDKFIHTNGQLKTNLATHFGVEESEVLNIKDFLTNNPHIKFAGLHFYLQSQYLNADNILENFKIFIDCTLKLQNHLSLKFEMLNLGGGFGIPYFEGQFPLDLDLFKAGLKSLLEEESTRQLKGISMYVESGRFISGPCGLFITKVLYTKISHGKKFIVCDGGMTQHQSSVGVGQIIRRHYPLEVMQFNESINSEKVTIVGPSCYSMDVMASEIELPVLSKGDYILIGQSGAYGATFSPQNFLSRPKSGEYTDEDL